MHDIADVVGWLMVGHADVLRISWMDQVPIGTRVTLPWPLPHCILWSCLTSWIGELGSKLNVSKVKKMWIYITHRREYASDALLLPVFCAELHLARHQLTLRNHRHRLIHCMVCLFTPQLLLSWYSLHLPIKGWPGWVDMCGWFCTKMVYSP